MTVRLEATPRSLELAFYFEGAGAGRFDVTAWLCQGYGNQRQEGFVLHAEGQLLRFSPRQASLLKRRLRRALGHGPLPTAGPRSRLSPLAVS